MDPERPERVPALPRSEIIPPVHPSLQDTTGTIQPDPFSSFSSNIPPRIDTSDLRPYPANAPSDSLKSDENEKLVSIQSPLPAHLSETNVRINNEQFPNGLTRLNSGIDWIVPTAEGEMKEVRHTVAERLGPTLEAAIIERDKYAAKAKWTGYALNVAIGLQVLLGSLTTGLSALSVSGGASTAKATTALGALATLVASYLARARGSNEPELSITRTKDLDQFIRECRAFRLDNGHLHGVDYDSDVSRLRLKFEELLGNANGERKLAPPV